MDRVPHQLSRLARGLGVALLGGLAACGTGEASARGQSSHVDSIVPREAALARFRENLPEVTRLTGGAPTREALVQRFVVGLEQRDRAALAALSLTRAEFAWLYYPTSPQGLPPYDLAPGLLWELTALASAKGLRRALQQFSGQPLGYAAHACDERVSRQGANTVTGPCVIRWLTAAGDTVDERLFGLIIERNGVHKFVSYANKL